MKESSRKATKILRAHTKNNMTIKQALNDTNKIIHRKTLMTKTFPCSLIFI